MSLKSTDKISVLVDQSGGVQQYYTIADINATVSAEESADISVLQDRVRVQNLAAGIIAEAGTICISENGTKVYICLSDCDGTEEDLTKWMQLASAGS